MDSNVFSHTDLLQLLDDYRPPYVSIFVPTHAASADRKQDVIRLGNLIREAECQLADRGTPSKLIRQLLKNMEELPRDSECWEHRCHGLAAYSAAGFFRCFSMPLRFNECVMVNDHFRISPLIPMLHANGRFFVLALTKDSADLYEATRFSMAERELPAMTSLALDGAQLPLQYHSHQIPSASNENNKEAMFHGQGVPADREKDDICNFFKRQVDPGVSFALRDQHAPLVLACVDFLVPLYFEANSYSELCSDHVSGSPTEMTENKLRESAWEVVAPSFHVVEERARRKYETLAGSERTQSTPDPILTAARRGRVDTLFIPRDGDELVSMSPSIEEAAEQTLLFGGQVLAVDEVPGDTALAAVLRY